MSVDVPNTPEVERLTQERNSRRESSGAWDAWNLGFIALAGIAALGLVVTGVGVSRSNKRLNDVSEELSHAKDLESEREASAARERTATLEKEAESERLARMKIEAKIAPRRLTALQKNRFTEILKPFSGLGQVYLLLINTADDSPDLASDFADAMQGAGVRTQISVLTGGEYFKGIYLQSDVDRLKEADAVGTFLVDVGLSRKPVTIPTTHLQKS